MSTNGVKPNSRVLRNSIVIFSFGVLYFVTKVENLSLFSPLVISHFREDIHPKSL